MRAIKPEVDVLHLESELNHLWGELNTATISYQLRKELEGKLGGLEEQFKAVMSGHISHKQLDEEIGLVDYKLAMGAIVQAEQEISKSEHRSSNYQALENVKKELEKRKITPQAARHEVKSIMRKH